jgi:hypothetical protein
VVLEHERVSGVGEQPQPGPGNTARDDARVARRLDDVLAAVGHQRGLPDPRKARIGPTAVAVPQPISATSWAAKIRGDTVKLFGKSPGWPAR